MSSNNPIKPPEHLDIESFPREYRFKMVFAYPHISEITEPYAASEAEIDAGFRKILANQNLARTNALYLEDRAKAQGGRVELW